MKAFIVDRYGSGGGNLRSGDVPEPEVGERDVLVQVRAAGVNALDSKIRDGEFKLILPYRLPFVLGNDLAGVVVRAGARVRKFQPGDEVYARPGKDRIGTFAEFISVSEDDLAPKPARLTMEEAAAVPLAALTAWQALVEIAGLRKGQKVLIHAGSGGVGTFAIQLAKYLGATVATTTSAANVDLVRRLGADVVINYREDDFETVLHGYDVVLNSLGGKTLRKSLRVLKPGGKLISISGPPDPAFAREIGKPWILRPADARPELPDQESGQAPPGQLLVPVHAGQRGPAPRDHLPHRLRDHRAGHRPGLPLRVDQPGHGLRRDGAREGQGRRHGEINRTAPSTNSADLARRLPNARLELYPDAGHGGIFQYHDTFVDEALKFLDS